jgi:hypothetical protein
MILLDLVYYLHLMLGSVTLIIFYSIYIYHFILFYSLPIHCLNHNVEGK